MVHGGYGCSKASPISNMAVAGSMSIVITSGRRHKPKPNPRSGTTRMVTFCNIVTVSPEAQGKGIGKLLFKHVEDQADKEGRKCYLESSRAVPNLKIYERLGFRLAREMICDDDGNAITLYCMVRDPQG